eukprot:1094936-Heterocapsa_arctica.AAC.1
MASGWGQIRAARRAIAWAALTRLRRRVKAAGGRAVRWLVGVPKTLSAVRHEELVRYIQQGGTYELYLAKMQAQQPGGCLTVVNGRR